MTTAGLTISDPARVRAGDADPLLAAWERLDVHSGWSMGCSAWLRAWVETSPPDDRVRLVAAGPPEAPVAVVPLADRGGRLVAVTGEEPADVPVAGAAEADAIARALLRLGRPVILPRLPAESPLPEALRRAARRRGVVIVRPAPGTPTIPLDDVDAEAPETLLSSRRRSDLRRARRRAEQIGAVSAEVHAPRDAGAAMALLEQAIAVEARSWKGREGTALASDTPEARAEAAAVRRFAELAAPQDILRIAFLRIDGEPAAMQIAVEKEGHYGLLKIGYDERFGRCSPGQLLMLEAIRHGAARGLGSIELLGAIEPWTSAWTKMERLCVSVRAYPARPGAMAALAADVAAAGARKAGRLVGERR